MGTAALSELVDQGEVIAGELGFLGFRHSVLVVALMFAFGHQCFRDPLYPWISYTLRHPGIATPAKRAARLERRALIWLEKVIRTS